MWDERRWEGILPVDPKLWSWREDSFRFSAKFLFFSEDENRFCSSLCVFSFVIKEKSPIWCIYNLFILLLVTRFLLVVFNFWWVIPIFVWFWNNACLTSDSRPIFGKSHCSKLKLCGSSCRGHSTLWSCNRVDNFSFFFLISFFFFFWDWESFLFLLFF